jgi:hypothetical protein
MKSGEATGGRSRGGTTGSHGPGTHEAEPERSIRIPSTRSRGPAPGRSRTAVRRRASGAGGPLVAVAPTRRHPACAAPVGNSPETGAHMLDSESNPHLLRLVSPRLPATRRAFIDSEVVCQCAASIGSIIGPVVQ